MVMVEETYLPLTLFVPNMTDAEFEELCGKYSDFRIEYTADGEVIIMPPTDPKTGIRNSAITKRLGNWADTAGRGYVTDSSAGFKLPSYARLSPDAAWISAERLNPAKPGLNLSRVCGRVTFTQRPAQDGPREDAGVDCKWGGTRVDDRPISQDCVDLLPWS